MTTQSGTINVTTENIFPIIKKFLYSDHEIFLRELVANAVDATQKLRTLADKGEFSGKLGEDNIEISINKEEGTLTITDKGIGLTAEEVEKYINQIAFSGAQEFLEKYKDESAIIGKFGLGFYSSFMVADKVKLISKSYKEGSQACEWTCDGSPNYELGDSTKDKRGTDIILFIDEENKEFLEQERIETLLDKYCKFLPVNIQFGTNERKEKKGEGDDAVEETIVEPNIINNVKPAWIKNPSELTREEYLAFYKELYPGSFDEPLFWIHLNVDYPFNLTGILYFPKLKNNVEVKKDRISLYCNQVFVTDQVEEIVPEFLMLLHGVIDSPDIPLNVSRSYLQSDPNVKKISNYISKKVASKLEEMFKKEREEYEKKWDDIGVFIKYGMLSDDKFYDKASKICLVQDTDDKFETIEEHTTAVAESQKDKNDRVVLLYTNSPTEQGAYISDAKDMSYRVLKMNTIIDSHFISMLETKLDKTSFKRVDADVADRLIEKEDAPETVLSEEETGKLKTLFGAILGEKSNANIEIKPLSPEAMPVMITKPEMMRRMQEMQAYNNMAMGDMPEFYNLVVNANHPKVSKVLAESNEDKQRSTIKQLCDLALLSQNMLKGEALSDFIKRSLSLMEE